MVLRNRVKERIAIIMLILMLILFPWLLIIVNKLTIQCDPKKKNQKIIHNLSNKGKKLIESSPMVKEINRNLSRETNFYLPKFDDKKMKTTSVKTESDWNLRDVCLGKTRCTEFCNHIPNERHEFGVPLHWHSRRISTRIILKKCDSQFCSRWNLIKIPFDIKFTCLS